MIVYKLKCINRHEFEGWFKSISSFEKQFEAKMIICPVCTSDDLKKVLSSTRSIKSKSATVATGGEDKARMQYALLRKMADKVKREFEDVGRKFPEEARKIHYGETPPRNIYGQTTDQEEKALRDEDIEFFKFPMLREPND